MSKSIPEIMVDNEVYKIKDREAQERLDEVDSGRLGTKQLVFNQDGTVTWTSAEQ